MPTNHCACNDRDCLCPVQGIIDIVSKKWAICLIDHLSRQPSFRYNEIKNHIGTISPKTLSDTLKSLEHEGLISRQVYPETPPRVEYALTPKGRDLQAALRPLLQWFHQSTRQ
jgi:DNA-binding HxlR family transcriptional regulator